MGSKEVGMLGIISPEFFKIRFLVTVPDWRPAEATLFQGFSSSLCKKVGLLRFIQTMPSDIFELTPGILPFRIMRRIAGLAPISWFGQSPRALRSFLHPHELPFTVIFLDSSESIADYADWIAACPGPITLVANTGGHISYSDLSLESVQARFLEVCNELRKLGKTLDIDNIQECIASWEKPKKRQIGYKIGGHGTIFPNIAVLSACGFENLAEDQFDRFLEGESAHLDQIIRTCNSIFDEREATAHSLLNDIFPRTPDLNLYCPSTYDLKSAINTRTIDNKDMKSIIESSIQIINQQKSYSFQLTSESQKKVLFGFSTKDVMGKKNPAANPFITVRAEEIWLGTSAVSCLATSEISAVVRLPNRLNLARGAVRQFAQHYRADKPNVRKRAQLFHRVQKIIGEGVPHELMALINRSQDGIRVIADAHLEWLDIRGIPLGLRYNVSRIPTTPGNLFIDNLATSPSLFVTPEDFHDILVVSGLRDEDVIAKQFKIAFDHFGKLWSDRLRIKFVRVSSRTELIDAINDFQGMLFVFDGHGSHQPDHPGLLWLGEEGVDVWGLRGDVTRPPPIVVLSSCDTHAADRNHATVANGFLALGSRSVLGSVFPLEASDAAIFAARLMYRISDYLPAAIDMFERSLTWLEVVSGMLRRQAATDILRHLQYLGLVSRQDYLNLSNQIHAIVDLPSNDQFLEARQALLNYGIPADRIDKEIHAAISASSTISYLHLGRPETIIINKTRDLVSLIELYETGQSAPVPIPILPSALQTTSTPPPPRPAAPPATTHIPPTPPPETPPESRSSPPSAA